MIIVHAHAHAAVCAHTHHVQLAKKLAGCDYPNASWIHLQLLVGPRALECTGFQTVRKPVKGFC